MGLFNRRKDQMQQSVPLSESSGPDGPEISDCFTELAAAGGMLLL